MNTAQTPQATSNEYKKFSQLVIFIATAAVVLVILAEATVLIIFPTISVIVASIIGNGLLILSAIIGVFIILKFFKSNIQTRSEAEEKYKQIIENIPDVIYTADIKGTTKYISPSVQKITGYTVEEFLSDNSNWFGGIHPDDAKKGIEAFEALFKSHKEFDIEYRYKTKDGRWIWIHDKSSKVYEKDGVMYADGVFSDITRDKENLEKINLQSQLLEAVNRAIIYTDLQGKILYWNKFAETQFGWKKEEVIGKSIIEVTPTTATQEQAKEIMTQLQKGESWTGEFYLKRKDGKEFPAIVTDAPFFDKNGVLIGIIGASMDISDRKKTEDELKVRSQELEKNQQTMLKLLSDISTQKTKAEQEKEKADVILKNIGEGLIVTDGRGKILLINKAGETLLGFIHDEVINKDYTEIIEAVDDHGNLIPEAQRPIFIARTTGKKVTGKYFYRCKDKTIKPVMLTVSPIIQNTEVVGVIAVFRDITKELEIDKAKSEFVSLASHELKTPLGIIKWYIESIKDDEKFNELSGQMKEYLDDIYKSNERILVLVRNLLDVSRIEQGRIKDKPESTSVVKLIQKVIEQLKPMIEKKNIDTSLVIENSDIPSIIIDPVRLEEVLVNLFSNAVKYNKDQGKLSVQVSKKADVIEIKVEDTGIGIPDKDLTHIYTKFFRADNALKTETDGTGLGLYMVKSYLEGWGGNINLDSKEGAGTKVTVQIPVSPKQVTSI